MSYKIERVNTQTFKINGASYNCADVFPSSDGTKKVQLFHKNGSFSLPILGDKDGVLWSDLRNSANAVYADFAAASAALAAVVAVGDGVGSILTDKGTVTQATNTGAAVTLNNRNGIISTFAQTLAADGTAVTFTVNNSTVTTASNVLLTAIYPVANTGTPVVSISSVANGSFVVEINNPGTAALNGANGTLKIGFVVL